MQYAATDINPINGTEKVVVVLPLEKVPFFDPANPPQKNTYGVPDEVEVGWIKDGDGWLPPPPPEPPTLEEIQAHYTFQVQMRLDNFARTRGYDGILSAATYVASEIEQFRREGQYAVHLRDITWAKCYEILESCLSGNAPIPAVEELLAMLPEPQWPGAGDEES